MWGTYIFTARSLCFSAELALYDMYTCATQDDNRGVGISSQLEMQEIALSNIKETCIAVLQFVGKLAGTVRARGLLRISPLVSDCLYQAARLYIWYTRGVGYRDDIEQAVREILDILQDLGRKWHVCSELFPNGRSSWTVTDAS